MAFQAYRLGPIELSVTGQGPVCKEICDELSVLESVTGRDADVMLRFVDDFEVPDRALEVGRWRLADGCVVGRGGGYRFCLRRRASGFVVDVVAEQKQRQLSDHVVRARNWNFLASWETTAKNIMYDLFDVVTAASILEHDASYLHASTCSFDGAAVAMIGWGGIGKTTSILKLITEDGWRFLSDDLGLVDTDGEVWRTPRRLQVYAYNVEGQPPLKRRLLRGRGPVDRINWYWRKRRFGPKKVRRRIEAEDLFGAGAVARSSPLEKAIFLQRADVDEMRWQRLGTDELARRSAAILVDELDPLFAIAVAAESHAVDIGIATSERLLSEARRILTDAFDGVDAEQLTIPVDAGPDALADALRPRLPR